MESSLNISDLWSHLHDNKLVKSDENVFCSLAIVITV